MRWGRLIQAALDCGLEREDAIWAVLAAARRMEQDGLVAMSGLSDPELRALGAYSEHGSYHGAARALGLAQSTVHRYVKTSATKLGVPARQAAAEASRLGLLDKAA